MPAKSSPNSPATRPSTRSPTSPASATQPSTSSTPSPTRSTREHGPSSHCGATLRPMTSTGSQKPGEADPPSNSSTSSAPSRNGVAITTPQKPCGPPSRPSLLLLRPSPQATPQRGRARSRKPNASCSNKLQAQTSRLRNFFGRPTLTCPSLSAAVASASQSPSSPGSSHRPSSPASGASLNYPVLKSQPTLSTPSQGHRTPRADTSSGSVLQPASPMRSSKEEPPACTS